MFIEKIDLERSIRLVHITVLIIILWKGMLKVKQPALFTVCVYKKLKFLPIRLGTNKYTFSVIFVDWFLQIQRFKNDYIF